MALNNSERRSASQIPYSDDISWNSKELRELKREMIDTDALSQLTQRSHIRWVWTVVFDLLIIYATVLLTETYFNTLNYLIAVIVIASRQVGIASIALHEGAHRLLSDNASSNHRIGTIILTALTVPCIGIDIESYRKGHHLDHHRFLLQESDPENEFFTKLYAMSKANTIVHFLSFSIFTLSGAGYLYGLLRQIICGKITQKIANTLLISVLLAGIVFNIYVIKMIFLYWIIPIATWALFVNSIRAMAEHYPSNAFGENFNPPQRLRTRDVIPTLFDKAFITSRNVNLHLSHHLFPAVPFYNLSKLQREISKTSAYQEFAHQTKGYHRFIYEYLFLKKD